MNWQKFLSNILHPVVIPTIGLLLYLFIAPVRLRLTEQLHFIMVIFLFTYILPLLILVILRFTRMISTMELPNIKERKIPLFIMMCVFLFLGRYFAEFRNGQELSYLFYGTLLGLIIMYLLFTIQIKTSIHLLSIGSALGYFIVIQFIYQISILPILIGIILLSGLLGASRLHLNAHKPIEVYLGFVLGIMSQICTYFILQ